MAATSDAPQQYKQPSRKGKKAWRKNVNISEVQEGLANVREDEIQGGLISEKPSQDLFTLDTTGSKAIQKAYNKTHKRLKADEILAQRSAVPAIDSRKRPSSRVGDGVVEPSSKKQRKGWVSHKELRRIREVAHQGAQLEISSTEDPNASAYDPWAEFAAAEQHSSVEYDFLEKPKQKVAPSTLHHDPVPLTASGKAPSAVQRPQPGTSYNPTFEDWDKLLTKVGQKEVEAEKQRLKEQQEAAARDSRIAQAATQGDAETDDETEWEGIESELDNSDLLNKKRPQRKTPAQRNKVKRRKEAERRLKHQRKMAQATVREEDIRAMEKSLRDRENEKDRSSPLESSGSEDESGIRLRRRRFGNMAIPSKALEVVLPDELQDSLRRLRPEGNLLGDRFRNILVQGKLETRRPISQPKKAKRTYTEKWTYKDWTL